ncbi:MAG: sigma-70 family RNA polymerase sigma factor [Polyangiaceae bacterium]|nr:sigma-70 family RNA polymerase sigma factor [Myxococcales bacterium]MCC6899782.1 sigma-70 family RNA polymerase sigma factor [Polyangiaceae bacterium]
MPAAALPLAQSWPGVVVPPALLAPMATERPVQHIPRVTARTMEPDESERLVERCREGDRTAFRELFVRHRTDVARLVQRMTGPGADVDDLVQEVFFQVHRSVKDFRGQARFSTWLYRVTVNVVLMQRRSAKSRPVLVETPEGLTAVSSGLAPDEDAARHARVRAFGRLLEQISEKKRTVFVLHELQGLSAAEISEIVDAPVLTVRTRLFYARKELAELLRSEPSLAALARELCTPQEAE